MNDPKHHLRSGKPSAAQSHRKSYQHYLKLVVFLEKLKRETDLSLGPKLLDKIIDAQREGQLSDDQVLELSGRIQHWIEKRQEFFASQEYQMKKLLSTMEGKDKRTRLARKASPHKNK
jgi:hypothetical protein